MENKNYTSKRIYPIAILLWIILWATLGSVVVQSSIHSARNEFNAKAMNVYHLVSDQIRTNETVVEGFAASVGAMGEIDRNKIRIYARQMLERYPHIFMFEIIEKVDAKNKESYEKNFQENISAHFQIRSFGYEEDRQWREAVGKNFYMPIIFMEPFPPESYQVLGLDLNSNKIFTDSLRASARLHMPVATRPFTLVEGHLAYLIHRPIKQGNNRLYTHAYDIEDRYVMLVILAKSLLKDMPEEMPDYGITLHHSDFDANDKRGHLYNQPAAEMSQLESFLLPNLSLNIKLDSKTQPFVLNINKQLGLSVFNFWLLSVFAAVAALSFYLLLKYLRFYRMSEIHRAQEAGHLFYLANHDSLTGLANRNLMLDRLQHALPQAKRRNSKLAVFFMDLDEFKKINDKYGHDVGDKLLTSASERLRACTRSGDTLARRSGDEFILILENIDDIESVHHVSEKIHQAFEQKFNLGEVELSVGITIGYSIYPDDAQSHDELLTIADKRMYANKRQA
ncbi:MAG: sensor domain-containing diguanylate cyclase [Thioalkalispiraceae bacterium]|jgi:diguanylate cyclase (GGDEF)-like protein